MLTTKFEGWMADESVTHAFGGIGEELKSFERLLKLAHDSDSLLDKATAAGEQGPAFDQGSLLLTARFSWSEESNANLKKKIELS